MVPDSQGDHRPGRIPDRLIWSTVGRRLFIQAAAATALYERIGKVAPVNPDDNWWDENVGGFFDAIGRAVSSTFLQTDAEKYADVMKQTTEQPWPAFGSDGYQGIWSQVIAIAIVLMLLVLTLRLITFVRKRDKTLVTDSAEDTLMLAGYALYGLVGILLLTILSDGLSHTGIKLFFPEGVDASGQPWYSGVLAVIGSVQDPQAKIIEKASIDAFVSLFSSSLVVMGLGAILTMVFIPVWRTSMGNFGFRWSLALALTAVVAKPVVITWLAFSVRQAELFPLGELDFSAPMMPSMPSWTTTVAGLIIVVTFFVIGGFIGKNPRLRSNRWKEVNADKINAKGGGFGVPGWGAAAAGAGGAAVTRRIVNQQIRAEDKLVRSQRTSMRAGGVSTAARSAQALVTKRAAASAAKATASKAVAGGGAKAAATAAAGSSAAPPLAAVLGAVAVTSAVVSRRAQTDAEVRKVRNRRSPTRM